MAINRITFSSNVLLIRDNILKVQQQYNAAATPAVSGKKLNSLSDDPSVTARLFMLRNISKQNTQYQRNIESANIRLNFTESRIAQSSDVLDRARDIALQANDSTVSSTLRNELVTQVKNLKDEILAHANATLEGKYIFAGTGYDTQPVVKDGAGVVTFNSAGGANTNDFNVQITASLSSTLSLNGNDLYTGGISTATSTSKLTTLKNSGGTGLNIQIGDVIQFNGRVGNTDISGQSLTVTASTTLSDLATAMQTALRSVADGDLTETAAVQGDGSIRITSDGASDIQNFDLSINGKPFFNTAFNYANVISSGGNIADSDTLQSGSGEDIFDVLDELAVAITNGSSEYQQATGTDLAINFLDANNEDLAVETGNVITISGSVGNVAIAGQTLTVSDTTDYDDIAFAIQKALRSVADGDATETVSVQSDGTIQITSDGTSTITNLKLSIPDNDTFGNLFTFDTPINSGGNTGSNSTVNAFVNSDITDSINRLDNAINQMQAAWASMGVRTQQIESIDTSLADDSIRIVEDLSNIEDANMDEVLSDLVVRETALRLVFSSASRILGVTSGVQLGI